MKQWILLFALFLTACAPSAAELPVPEEERVGGTLIVVGQGGDAVSLFTKTAETFQREYGGTLVQTESGDAFIKAVNDFVATEGKIERLEYFGHGNHVALFLDQTPGVNGGLYANDPAYNEGFRAASIYELSRDVFTSDGVARFNGCNVARGYPDHTSFAQSFSNHFDVKVVAPLGPTEFSTDPDFKTEPINANDLPSTFNGDIYLVPTYYDKGYMNIPPEPVSTAGFVDVREGQAFAEAVDGLKAAGLKLDADEDEFHPYWNGSFADAELFCQMVAESGCETGEEGKIRNLEFLKLLMDAQGIDVKYTEPWHSSYIGWASAQGVLTEDFTHKKWYSRGEMAEMTWKMMQLGELDR